MTEWEALKEECLRCQACTLAATRTNVVFGVGSEDAEVLFIGEAPGANEDAQGEPFVGRAGKLLDDMLAMKEKAGVSSRCMPLKQSGTTGKCVVCGKECTTDIYWGVAY